jgi:hypothetical protein
MCSYARILIDYFLKIVARDSKVDVTSNICHGNQVHIKMEEEHWHILLWMKKLVQESLYRLL